MSNLHKHLLASAAGIALAVGGASGALANPLPFSINPNAIGVSGYSTAVTATDINGNSDSLITQTTPILQTETGWLQVTGYTNNGNPVPFTAIGSPNPGSGLINAVVPNTYDIYINFTATVNTSGFGAGGGIGTVQTFSFTAYADPQQDDVLSAATISGGVATAPSVTNTNNDEVLAVGNLVAGTAGFQPTTGAPTFNAVSDFILCNGTSNSGTLGGSTVAAPGCGTFNASNYFVAPIPFYSLNFTSNTAGSILNIGTGDGSVPDAVTLNGIVTDINFLVPEPTSLALLGGALVGLGGLSRRRRRKGQAPLAD